MKDKITVGLFIDTYYPMVDGVITVVDNYARRLTNYANVVVFAPKVSGKDFDDTKLPYKVVRCNSLKLHIIDYSLPIPKFDRKFKKILKSYDLDIIHIHSPFMLGKMGIKYAKKHKIPVIGTMHSQFKKDFKRAVKIGFVANIMTKITINVFNKCDECWAVNNEVARIFHKDYHYKTMPKVTVNATDMKPVDDVEKYSKLINEKHNLSEDEKVFLFVGRYTKLKNIFFLAESIKILNKKDPDFKFKMLFVGSGQDEEELKKWIKDNNMEDIIILCGRVIDRDLLCAYYLRADLFLFPSLYDASSLVQIEAASQKTPTIFVKGAATTATITDNVNGLISDNNEEAYAEKILEILNDKDRYKNLCENAYKDLYKNWDDVVKDVYEEYTEFIRKYKG